MSSDGAAASAAEPRASDADAPVAEPVSAAPVAAASEVKESLAASIMRLKWERAAAREARKRLSKELHNAQRRASRLKKRARQLTDLDLLEVLRMREEKASEAAATSSSAAATEPGVPPAA